MQRLLILFVLTLSTVSFAQKKKPAIRYRSIDDKTFAVGDRIDMGTVEVVVFSLDKDSVVIPDSLALYRRFVQNNPHMTYKLHMLWKNQGVKSRKNGPYARNAADVFQRRRQRTGFHLRYQLFQAHVRKAGAGAEDRTGDHRR
jgi:hypothetical protein